MKKPQQFGQSLDRGFHWQLKRIADGHVLQEGFGLEDDDGKVIVRGLTLGKARCELSIRKDAATIAYCEWLEAHSLSGADALFSADTDADKIDQLTEYVFGGNPRNAESKQAIFPRMERQPENVGFHLLYRRRSNAASQGLTYRVLMSATLQPGTWTEPAGTGESISIIGPGLEEVTLSLGTTPPSESRFLKVQASLGNGG